MKVFKVMLINDPESEYSTISLHKTMKGARSFLAKYLMEEIRPEEHEHLMDRLSLIKRAKLNPKESYEYLNSRKMYHWLHYGIEEEIVKE